MMHLPLRQRVLKLICFSLILSTFSHYLLAGPREQAQRLHDRLAGVPANEATLSLMATSIEAGNTQEAANMAMENPAFYDITLKLFAAPWTNEEQSVYTPLNDYIATVIGIIRDDLDFRTLLYDDVIYIGKSDLALPAYSNSNNTHYEQLEQQSLSLKQALVSQTQSSVTGLPANATAGVMTSRAASKAFFIDGTNRAMFRFTMLNHLCEDMEQIKDNTRPNDRIRQDVTRSPGGDSRIFMNACMGCHAGMDPMAQAMAYYNYEYDSDADPEGNNGQLSYNGQGIIDPETDSRVKAKYRINANNFIHGFVTPDDKWDNYWREGDNQFLGWDPSLPGSGSGLKTMAQELAHSTSFGDSKKLHDLISATGEYSIEAWLAPANVSQDGPARIVSYSAGAMARNFTLGQSLYNYNCNYSAV